MMKYKIISLMAFSMILLSACGSETGQASITDSVVLQETEGISDTGSEQTSEVTAPEAETAQEQVGTTASLPEKTEVVTVSETETEPAVSDSEMTDNSSGTVPAQGDSISYQLLDVSLPQDNFYVRGSLICAPKYNSNGVDYSGQADLNFIDINTNKIVGTVSLPSGFSLNRVYPMSGNTLVKIISRGYDFETGSEKISSAVVYDDFRLEIIDNADVNDVYFEHYGHKLSQWERDILTVDGESEVIVPGGFDGYGLYTTSQTYMLPIDENHFVYYTAGALTSSVGIYNFSVRTASDFPDSKGYIPIGVHNGKIYAVRDGNYTNGTDLYIMDINKFDINFFMAFPYELEPDESVYYYMSPDGDNVVILKTGAKKGVTPAIYIADPDTAEIKYTYEFPDGYEVYNSLFFIGDNKFATGTVINKEAKLMIFTLPEQ